MIFLFLWQTQTERKYGTQIKRDRKKISWNIFTHQSVFESILFWIIKVVQTFHKVDHNYYVEEFMETTRNQDSELLPIREAESSFPVIKWTEKNTGYVRQAWEHRMKYLSKPLAYDRVPPLESHVATDIKQWSLWGWLKMSETHHEINEASLIIRRQPMLQSH